MNKGFLGFSSPIQNSPSVGVEEAPLDGVYYGRRNGAWTNLKTYFDTLYQAVGTYLTSANIEDAINNGTTDKAPSENAVYDALALKLTANSPITGATKTKITYDANGLVTAGADAAYTDLTGRPAAETNTNDIFRCDSPGGVSAFVGTIATLPGGATLTYNVTSGQEGAMVPTSTSQLAKMRLWNTTRGTYALISNCVTGTNTITLTANVPAGWVVGDTITIASQTVSGAGLNWVDLEITSTLTGKSSLFFNIQIISATVGDAFRIHPFETFGTSKIYPIAAQVTTIQNNAPPLIKIVSDTFTVSWTGTPTTIYVREIGDLK